MVNFSFVCLTFMFTILIGNLSVSGLPSEDDIPEKILTTEIITEVPSPTDNKPITTVESVLLQEKIKKSPFPPEINSELRHKIFLLKILKMIRGISPLNN